MSLNVDMLSEIMFQLFKNIEVDESVRTLENLKSDLKIKSNNIKELRKQLMKEKGRFTKRFIDDLEKIEVEFIQLYENFDDKLMLFIIGNGNVGKSTLLNALVGEKVAMTGTLPNTWKIDVYSKEIEEDKALIKYDNGESYIRDINEVKNIIKQEELKTKDSTNKLNKAKREKLKGLKTKEEREEMKKYLEETLAYISNVSEVRWPVKRNWILDRCLLVDTPGLNQNLNNSCQIGNIYSYYHKADGVIWLLDGQTIAAQNANNTFKELEEELKKFNNEENKVRNNIIGVINRIDLVEKNGGKEAVKKVISDAERFFGDRFYKIIDISAFKAEQGIINNNNQLIDESKILDLQNLIKEIFIAKSESIKNDSKLHGHNRLVESSINILNQYKNNVSEYKAIYEAKENKVDNLTKEYIDEIKKEINRFIDKYLLDVSLRVDRYIDELSNGKNQEYVMKYMYRLDEFKIKLKNLIVNKQNEIKSKYSNLEKICMISEYKYINVNKNTLVKKINIDTNIEISVLEDIGYFNPSNSNDIISILGNFIGKGIFWFKKSYIKNTINNTISEKCLEIKEELIKEFEVAISLNVNKCKLVLNSTFEQMLFRYNKIDNIVKLLYKFENDMKIDKEKVKLEDIIF